jgi:integrase
MREEKLVKLHCNSVFAPYIAEFIGQKRALGNKYNVAAEVLNLFDDFCVQQDIQELALSELLYQKWSLKRPSESDSTHILRLTYTRSFSKFLYNNGIDAPATFHPLPRGSKAFVPYIFTKDEINRFLDTVDKENQKVNPNSPIRHLVFPVLFRMLYTCGLRLNEALHLKVEDVDLEQGVLLVRNAKGGKDRMVVMSDSMTTVCYSYRLEKAIENFPSEYFFPAPDRGFYDSSTVYDNFRRYLHKSGIPHKGRGNGPRLHDFRHTFAVHVLNSWAEQGKDLYTCLPILSTYLGHSRLTGTQKYLQLVPEAYGLLTDSFESKYRHIFPEVQDEE